MTPPPHLMACMEVWGGNRAFDGGVVMAGLDAWLYSRPYSPAGQAGPAAEAGGDLHFLTSCATGRITRLALCDVSGHGAPVARAADALRALVRRHSNHIDQTRLVAAVNRQFDEIAAEFGAMFATAVFATYFAPADELAVSNAGHPRPVRFDARAGRWSRIEPPGADGPAHLPLGIDPDATYAPTTIRLAPGDLVLIFSDSLIEVRLPGDRLLGQDGLLDLLNALDHSRAESLVRDLLEAAGARSATPDRPFDDDVTVLLIRPNTRKPRPSLQLGLAAGGRIARDAIRSLRPGALPATFPDLSLRSIGGAMVDRLNGRR